MDEPNRIGLTAAAMARLEELIEELNPADGEEGTRLIKFDLYRLAVAIGIKNQEIAPQLAEKSTNSFRVTEFDIDGTFFTTLENGSLVPDDVNIYGYIERLAEHGINEMYEIFQKTGQLPFEKYFTAE